jgi:hypothetical protein
MSGFWNTSEGENVAKTKTDSFEIEGGNLEPIPDGSSLLAMVEEAKWSQDKNGNEFITIKWNVMRPEAYANRRVFQKLWVTDDDPSAKDADKAAKKRDKALRMLAAIDTNAGGRLTKVAGKPDDEDLAAALAGKAMIIKVMLWEIEDRQTGETIRGNWVSAVSPKGGELKVGAEKEASAKPAQKQAAKSQVRMTAMDDDSIPF